MSVQSQPDQPDDPRLEGWYHTIELGGGLVSKGVYDHRPIVDRYGFPESLEGKSALDVGTCDGFFAFEMERRGADPVVAIDLARYGDFDWLPWIREKLGRDADRRHNFDTAHAMRGSKVRHRICSVYDLSPETVGTFDCVFCGSLLLHLMNPLQALVNIRSVTREMAIVETTTSATLERASRGGKPLLSFGYRARESDLGESCIYWRFSTAALEEMLLYAGFSRVECRKPFRLPPHGLRVTAAIAYP